MDFTIYFQQCFDEVDKQYDDASLREKKLTREDWAHGALLVINELLRCSNVEGEVSWCPYIRNNALKVNLYLKTSFGRAKQSPKEEWKNTQCIVHWQIDHDQSTDPINNFIWVVGAQTLKKE